MHFNTRYTKSPDNNLEACAEFLNSETKKVYSQCVMANVYLHDKNNTGFTRGIRYRLAIPKSILEKNGTGK